jgi:hypothetical protein
MDAAISIDEHGEPYHAWVRAQRRLEALHPGSKDWQAAMRDAVAAWDAMAGTCAPRRRSLAFDAEAPCASAR